MKKAELIAGAVATLCIAGVVTLLSWPKFQDGTWQTVTPPAWWQLEWLAAIGVGLSVLPSFVVAAIDKAIGMPDGMRYIPAGTLLVLEIAVVSFVVYKVTRRLYSAARAQQTVQPDRREDAAPG